MKTAEEWIREYAMKMVRPRVSVQKIREIQSDSLRHAADTVYGNRLLHGEGLAAQKSIAAIIEEAEKLETK